MNCPSCTCRKNVQKRGFYRRPSDQKKVQRYYCKPCKKGFSEQTFAVDYRHRKRWFNQACFTTLCSGVSQRRLAYIFGVVPRTIARRVIRFGVICSKNLDANRRLIAPVKEVQFDELESFIHTKLKPVTIPIAVEKKTRRVLAVEIGNIGAKGSLKYSALQKYGKRPSERKSSLKKLMKSLQVCVSESACFGTDQAPLYPKLIREYFPKASHKTSKGSRGAVVGLGELKKIAFDPLFTLNHTYAMFRDNLKTLSRRTWATAKRKDRLFHLINIYAWFHNLWLDRKKKKPKIEAFYILAEEPFMNI
jgi:transposase-like protein